MTAQPKLFAARAALIDLDGTLVDSLPDIAFAVNAMCIDLGRDALPIEQIKQYVGKGVDVLVHRTLTQTMDRLAAADVFASGKQSFTQHYRNVNGNESRVFAGVREGLDDLRRRGIALACVTNKPREFTLQLLYRIDLRAAFEVIVSGDDTVEKKPGAEPMLHACALLGVAVHDAVVIGDSVNDVQSARSAGCPVIAVETGYSEGQSVFDLGADVTVPSLLHAARLIELPQ